jgi:hypothetical protein
MEVLYPETHDNMHAAYTVPQHPQQEHRRRTAGPLQGPNLTRPSLCVRPDRRVGRRFKLNLTALFKHGTVEFRHPASTMDPHAISGWVLLCLTMVQSSKDEASLQRLSPAPDDASAQEQARPLELQCLDALQGCVAATQKLVHLLRELSEDVTARMEADDAAAFALFTTSRDRLCVTHKILHCTHEACDEVIMQYHGSVFGTGEWCDTTDVVACLDFFTDRVAAVRNTLAGRASADFLQRLSAAAAEAECALRAFRALLAQAASHSCWCLAQLQGTGAQRELQQLPEAEQVRLAPLVHWLQQSCAPNNAAVLTRWVVEQALWCAGEGRVMLEAEY